MAAVIARRYSLLQAHSPGRAIRFGKEAQTAGADRRSMPRPPRMRLKNATVAAIFREAALSGGIGEFAVIQARGEERRGE
jgi:hypothetical protein